MKLKPLQSAVATIVFTLGASLANAADLVTNGDFSGGLGGWDVVTLGTGVTYDATDKLARIGQPGSPGTATLKQTLTPSSATSFSVQFDYLWQVGVNASNQDDSFTAFLSYTTNDVAVVANLLTEFASVGDFANAQSFSTTINLPGLPPLTDLTIGFTLAEGANLSENSGTRVHLDNVVVSEVPLPAAVLLFGSALIGFVGISRRRGIFSKV